MNGCLSLTRLWALRGPVWTDRVLALKKVIVYREKCSHDSVSVQDQSGDRCFLRKLERLDEGKPGLSTSKNEQEKPVKEAGAQRAQDLLQPLSILVLMNIEGNAKVIGKKAGEAAKGNYGGPGQPLWELGSHWEFEGVGTGWVLHFS